MVRLRWTGRGLFTDADPDIEVGPGAGRPREVDVGEETADRYVSEFTDWVRVDHRDADDAATESDSTDAQAAANEVAADSDAGDESADDAGDGESEATSEPPVDPTSLTVDALEERLEEGDYSASELDAIEAAEESRPQGARKTALESIDKERE